MADGAGRVALLVGTYSRNGGRGIRLLWSGDGTMEAGPLVSDVADASHGLWSADRSTLYVVGEEENGRVNALRSHDGVIARVWSSATGGAAPCHLALDSDGAHLIAANYESGSVAFLRLDATGCTNEPIMWRLSGSGPDRSRQAGPHAHWVGTRPGSEDLYCVDLGSDTVWRFDRSKGAPVRAFVAPAGTGPRHLAFHPHAPLALLVGELSSTLTLLAVAPDGDLRPIVTRSTLPSGAGRSLGGHVLLNHAADRVYVTNRGHDSIAVFALNRREICLLQHVPSSGASPRFMLLLEAEQRLIVANEEGGTVQQFHVRGDGMLILQASADVPGAVFLIEAS